MYVGLKMLREFPTVSPATLVIEADKIMETRKVWMLPVTENGHLVGYINKEDVRAALPSPMTTLSRHELNYLLQKLTIGKIIHREAISVLPETDLEEAAKIMQQNDLTGLAVVSKDNRLVGVINRSVMLDILTEQMGLKQGGERLTVEVLDRTGVIAEIASIVAGLGVSIISMATFFHGDQRMLVLRLKTEDPAEVIKALAERGYKAVGPEHFAGEWS